MTKTVEFFFDVGSPAAYLAWTQLPQICADADAKLVYKPMLLGAVFQETGNISPGAVPAKGRWIHSDFKRFAKHYGVPFRFNPHFPINTLALMRAVIAQHDTQPERLPNLLSALFNAIWVEQKNMNDTQVVAEVLQQAGFDPQAVLEQTQQNDVKQALIATTTEAIERGVFGAPTCFVGEEMFFGQDRLMFVQQALQ